MMNYYFRSIGCIALAAILLLISGCATTPNDLLRQMEHSTPTYSSLKELQFEQTMIGRKEEFKLTTNSPIFEFTTGKSYLKAIELPVTNKPYYLILKSYFVSPLTDISFQVRKDKKWYGDPATPFVFPPYIVTLDEKFNRIREISTNAFQLVSTMRRDKKLFVTVPSGKTWLQTAIRFSPDSKERYVVVFTTPELLKNSTSIKSSMWTYGGNILWGDISSQYFHYEAYHIPIGKLHLALVYPEELFWMDEESMGKLPKAIPGEVIRTKWFDVRSPENGGYRIYQRGTFRTARGEGKYIGFTGSPRHPDINTFFIYSLPLSSVSGEVLDSYTDRVIAEYSSQFDGLSYQKSDIAIGERLCRRLDLNGKVKNRFFSPIKGYDILCVIPTSDGSLEATLVRIGGNVVYPPEANYQADLNELNGFITNIRLHAQ